MGGLAFRYIGNRKPSKMKTQVKIFNDNDFYLDAVPCETVSDFESNQGLFTSLVMRQSGVQFGQLKPNLKCQLEYFIQNHAVA
jgi:hypothetical protein